MQPLFYDKFPPNNCPKTAILSYFVSIQQIHILLLILLLSFRAVNVCQDDEYFHRKCLYPCLMLCTIEVFYKKHIFFVSVSAIYFCRKIVSLRKKDIFVVACIYPWNGVEIRC